MSKSNSHPEMQTKSLMSTEPLPASCKVYRNGKMYDDVRVAMREITVSSTPTVNHQNGDSTTPGIVVYDTSGPYTDPTVQTEVRKGLEPLRLNWILARGEVEESPTHPIQPSGIGGGALRAFSRRIAPPGASSQARQKRDPDAFREKGRDHAGDGIHCHP